MLLSIKYKSTVTAGVICATEKSLQSSIGLLVIEEAGSVRIEHDSAVEK